MYQPYGYGYPPPMIPPFQGGPDQQKYIEFGMKQAEKLMLREQREFERNQTKKKHEEKENRKAAEARRTRTLLSIEWYVLGIISYPLWAPLYQHAIKYASQ